MADSKRLPTHEKLCTKSKSGAIRPRPTNKLAQIDTPGTHAPSLGVPMCTDTDQQQLIVYESNQSMSSLKQQPIQGARLATGTLLTSHDGHLEDYFTAGDADIEQEYPKLESAAQAAPIPKNCATVDWREENARRSRSASEAPSMRDAFPYQFGARRQADTCIGARLPAKTVVQEYEWCMLQKTSQNKFLHVLFWKTGSGQPTSQKK